MIWNVTIPDPTDRELTKRKLTISRWIAAGPINETSETIVIPQALKEYQFEMDDSEWVGNTTNSSTGPVFSVWIEYANGNSSRLHKRPLFPTKVT